MLSPNLTVDTAYAALTGGLRTFFARTGRKKAVLGLSGGIDSAVVAALAVQALGSDNVHGFLMPSEFSTLHSIQDAVDLADNLGMQYHVVPIGGIYNRFMKELSPVFGPDNTWNVAEENLQARIRGTLLMAYSNKFDALVLNTSNKSELSVGYGTLYGDLAGALMVIADLYKTDVYALASYINRDEILIPASTMTKAPSAELREGQKDSDSLPDYAVLDRVLYALHEEGRTREELLAIGIDPQTLAHILRLREGAAFKVAQVPPILNISEKPIGYPQKWVL